jgi:hypothetical protein
VRGHFSNRARDVVEAIQYARRSLAEADIGIDTMINIFQTKSRNHMGTHTNRFFLHMRDVFTDMADNIPAALERLRLEIEKGDFLR